MENRLLLWYIFDPHGRNKWGCNVIKKKTWTKNFIFTLFTLFVWTFTERSCRMSFINYFGDFKKTGWTLTETTFKIFYIMTWQLESDALADVCVIIIYAWIHSKQLIRTWRQSIIKNYKSSDIATKKFATIYGTYLINVAKLFDDDVKKNVIKQKIISIDNIFFWSIWYFFWM